MTQQGLLANDNKSTSSIAEMAVYHADKLIRQLNS